MEQREQTTSEYPTTGHLCPEKPGNTVYISLRRESDGERRARCPYCGLVRRYAGPRDQRQLKAIQEHRTWVAPRRVKS